MNHSLNPRRAVSGDTKKMNSEPRHHLGSLHLTFPPPWPLASTQTNFKNPQFQTLWISKEVPAVITYVILLRPIDHLRDVVAIVHENGSQNQMCVTPSPLFPGPYPFLLHMQSGSAKPASSTSKPRLKPALCSSFPSLMHQCKVLGHFLSLLDLLLPEENEALSLEEELGAVLSRSPPHPQRAHYLLFTLSQVFQGQFVHSEAWSQMGGSIPGSLGPAFLALGIT